MRLRFFGGLGFDGPGGTVVRGRGQEALLLRLALDTGTTVRYRALIEDIWPDDPPEDPRASLQSLASRLRRALPDGLLEAAPGGYRLTLPREDVDLTAFQDLVAQARRAEDPRVAADLARRALDLWTGDPWTPADGFDWVVGDLFEDRGHAQRLVRAAEASAAPVAGASPGDPDTPGVSGSVPAALTSLVGRLDELDLIAAQLATERLVTLIGPGGAGKTTLAQETARRRPGSLMVELAPAGPDEVWAAMAGVVGRTIRLADSPTVPVTARDRALEALAGRRLLLVMDNCEHVSAAAAAVALDLLRELPGVQLLATSREPLGLPGEAFVDLGPLPESDAVELFSRRVRAARGRAPEPTESEATARIVRRLDGLPLALELAAARSRTLSLAEIDAGLDDRFALLVSGPRAADHRHQTLRALIDWSWETLTEPERTALLAVSVFPDGVAAADAAVVAEHFATIPEAVDQLIDRSLLRRASGRLRMLETVREYGLDRLRASGEHDEYRARQARAVAELAGAQDALLRGPAVRVGLAWFDANEENVGVAMRTAAATEELRPVGVQLVRASMWAWMMRERFEDLQASLRAFAASDAPLDSEAAVVVHGLGLIVGSLSAAMAAERAAELADRDGQGPAQPPPRDAGVGAAFPTDPAEFDARRAELTEGARLHPSELAAVIPAMLTASAAALRQSAEPGISWARMLVIPTDDLAELPEWSQAFLSLMRAVMAQNAGDLAVLGFESERAVRMFDGLGDVWGIALSCQMRSEWLMLQGRLDEALVVADRAMAGLQGLTSAPDLIQQHSLALSIVLRQGRHHEARRRLAEIESIARADGSERAVMQAQLAAAGYAIAVGDGPTALRHLDAVPDSGGSPFMDQLMAWDGALRARALLLCDRPQEARAALREAMPAALRSADQPIIADTVLTLAEWLAATGQRAQARQALASSVRIRGGLDAHEPSLARLVEELGPPDPDDDADLTALVALLD